MLCPAAGAVALHVAAMLERTLPCQLSMIQDAELLRVVLLPSSCDTAMRMREYTAQHTQHKKQIWHVPCLKKLDACKNSQTTHDLLSAAACWVGIKVSTRHPSAEGCSGTRGSV